MSVVPSDLDGHIQCVSLSSRSKKPTACSIRRRTFAGRKRSGMFAREAGNARPGQRPVFDGKPACRGHSAGHFDLGARSVLPFELKRLAFAECSETNEGMACKIGGYRDARRALDVDRRRHEDVAIPRQARAR